MSRKWSFILVPLIIFVICVTYIISTSVFASVNKVAVVETSVKEEPREVLISVVSQDQVKEEIEESDAEIAEVANVEESKEMETIDVIKVESKSRESYFTVPFYSQFTDISKVNWQKIGCGIASLAMMIDFYSNETISADELLDRGIASGAYLDSAGWIHSGLINLSKQYGLDGQSVSLASLSSVDAFNQLKKVVDEGPVIASVHYTFEPSNPIPHLVVITGVKDEKVFYNDPAESSGGGMISVEKFKLAWKQRYIEIRPS